MLCLCLFTLSPGNVMLTPFLPISLLVVRAFAGESTTTTSTPSTRSLLAHATHHNLNHNRDRTYYALSHLLPARSVAKRSHCSYEYRRSRWQATLHHESAQLWLADSVAVCLAPNACLAQTPRLISAPKLLLVELTGTPEPVLVRAPRKAPLPRMSRKVWLHSSPRSQP
jgi:hypothetical protein